MSAMKQRNERVREDAAQSGLDLYQIRCCYAQNPTPFAILRSVTSNDRVTDMTFVYVNHAFEHDCGLMADTLIGRPYSVLFPGEQLEHYLAEVGAVAEEGNPTTLYNFRDALGRYLKLDCFNITQHYCGVMIYDVSDQHLLEIRGSDELSALLHSVEGGLLMTSLTDPPTLLYANHALCTLLGYGSIEEAKRVFNGGSLYGQLHDADAAILHAQMHRLNTQDTFHCILRVMRKNGAYVWLSTRGKRVILPDCEQAVITTAHDITEEMERQHADKRLSRQMLQNISSQYYAAYYVHSVTGNIMPVRHDFADMPDALLTATGYEKWLSNYVHAYVHPDDRQELLQNMSLDAFRYLARSAGCFRLLSKQYRRRFGEQYEWVEALMSMNEAERPEDELLTLAFRNVHHEKLAEIEKRYLEVFSYAVTHSYEAVLEYDPTSNALMELKLGETGLYRTHSFDTTVEERIRFATLHIHPDDIDRFMDEISLETMHSLDLSHKVTFEYRRRMDEDTEYRWCAYSMRKFEQNNRKLYILFVKDIHETKVRHLRQQQRLQTAVVEAERRVLEKTNELFTYYGKTIELMSSVVEYRSLESGEHVRRIKNYTQELLRAAAALFPEQRLTEEKIRSITEASALHDVGKIGVPDNILLKPARLTKDEFEIMKQHTIIGADIAREIPFVAEKEDEYGYGYDIARYHHERYDGRGYPEGLKGDSIPFCAQIVAVADVFDALTTERVYKEAYSKERAYTMILNGECGIFAPRILDCFLQVRPQFEALADNR